MNSEDNIILSLLHSAGLTQKDLTKIVESGLSVVDSYEKLLRKDSSFVTFFGQKRFEKIIDRLPKIDREMHKNFVETQKIRIISRDDEEFPAILKNIFNVPQILYVQGNITPRGISIGVVGSRKFTNYGKSALEKIFSDFPTEDVTIVSGGAYGIDTLAHETALQKGFHTIAVFGTGINISYPSNNRSLFSRILQNWGGLISIFPIDTSPEAYNFPVRNEIVAGLSDVIFIPEASQKSGTLITAKLALDLGKDIYVVPGDIFRETSMGTNALISQGSAYPILSGEILFSDWNLGYVLKKFSEEKIQNSPANIPKIDKINFSSSVAKTLYEAIMDGKNTVDMLISDMKIPFETITMELTMMELDGHIRVNEFGVYEII